MLAHEILVSAQGPLVLGFWVWGLGVWALARTILSSSSLSPLVTYLAFELGLTGLGKGLGGLGTKSMGRGLDNFPEGIR